MVGLRIRIVVTLWRWHIGIGGLEFLDLALHELQMDMQRIERIADLVCDAGGQQRECLDAFALDDLKGFLLLLDGVESVLQIDLLTTAVSSVDLPEAPTGLGSTPSGRFFITHDSPLGLVSFLDPETGNIDTVSGFAAAGLFTDDTLVRIGDDAE